MPEVEVAHPADPDVDCDVKGCHITQVFCVDYEMTVTASGGCGRWVSQETGEMVDIAEVTDIQFDVGYQTTEEAKVVAAVLERWQAEGTLARFTCAPGKMSRLEAMDGETVVFPRASPDV